MHDFLRENSVAVAPVIIVHCCGEIDNANLMLLLNDEKVYAAKFASELKSIHYYVRLVFDCETNEGNVKYTNTVYRPILDAKMFDFQKYARSITSTTRTKM